VKPWHEISGYFTFPQFYDWVARESENGGRAWHGIEVGVYTGQSAAYLMEAIICFFGDKGGIGLHTLDLVDFEMTKHRTRENLERYPMGTFHELDSVEASKLYADASLDFVFIDADHRYEMVARDIDAWLPKVKRGGIIAGHDFCNWPGFGVIQAVTERFERFEVWRGSKGMGDAQMLPHYWPVWCVRV
jgi:predicted O-methyltransferase YrrM